VWLETLKPGEFESFSWTADKGGDVTLINTRHRVD
jgi:hypothetical protein